MEIDYIKIADLYSQSEIKKIPSHFLNNENFLLRLATNEFIIKSSKICDVLSYLPTKEFIKKVVKLIFEKYFHNLPNNEFIGCKKKLNYCFGLAIDHLHAFIKKNKDLNEYLFEKYPFLNIYDNSDKKIIIYKFKLYNHTYFLGEKFGVDILTDKNLQFLYAKYYRYSLEYYMIEYSILKDSYYNSKIKNLFNISMNIKNIKCNCRYDIELLHIEAVEHYVPTIRNNVRDCEFFIIKYQWIHPYTTFYYKKNYLDTFMFNRMYMINFLNKIKKSKSLYYLMEYNKSFFPDSVYSLFKIRINKNCYQYIKMMYNYLFIYKNKIYKIYTYLYKYNKSYNIEKIVNIFAFYNKFIKKGTKLLDPCPRIFFYFMLKYFNYNMKIRSIDNKKIFSKFLFYYPSIINHFHNKNSNAHTSKFINYDDTIVKSNLSIFYNHNYDISKLVRKENAFLLQSFLSLENDKKKIMEICSKINFGILDKCQDFIKDHDVISIELRKDINMIKCVDISYINKYIECEFDLERTLRSMKSL